MKSIVQLSVVVIGLSACSQRLLPSTADAPESASTSMGGLPPGHPPIAGGTSGTGASPASADGQIDGRLEIGADVAKQVAKGDTIYIIARDGQTNAMVAVAKLTAPEQFPLPFSLTQQNVMIPGSSLRGSIKLSARVDKDGDAMTKKPGDVVGEMAAPVQVPAKDVVLKLDHLL